jgi:hypothetical protein
LAVRTLGVEFHCQLNYCLRASDLPVLAVLYAMSAPARVADEDPATAVGSVPARPPVELLVTVFVPAPARAIADALPAQAPVDLSALFSATATVER